MAQYIEKEKLYQKLHEAGGCRADKGSWADGWDQAIDEAIRLLDALPPADVVSKDRFIPLDNDDTLVRVFEHYKKTVSEEIFKAIFQILADADFKYEEIPEQGNPAVNYIFNAVSELKKRYT